MSSLTIAQKLYLFIGAIVACLLLFGLFYLRTTSNIIKSLDVKEKAGNIQKYFYQISRDVNEFRNHENPEILKRIRTNFDLFQKSVEELVEHNQAKNIPLKAESIRRAKAYYLDFIERFGQLNQMILDQKNLRQQIEDKLMEFISKGNEVEANLFIINTMKQYRNQKIDLRANEAVRVLKSSGHELVGRFVALNSDIYKLYDPSFAPKLDDYKASFGHNMEAFREESGRLKEHLASLQAEPPEGVEDFVELGQQVSMYLESNAPEYLKLVENLIDVQKENGTVLAEMSAIEQNVAEVSQELYLANKQYADRVKRGTQAVVITVILVISGLLTGFGLVTTRSVLDPVHSLMNKVKQLAESEGDLTTSLPVTNRDEIGELCLYFNKFLATLREIIRIVVLNAKNTATIAEELSSASEEISASSEGVSTAMDDLARQGKRIMSMAQGNRQEVEKLRDHISAVVQSNTETLENSREVNTAAQEGIASARRAWETMEEIKQSVEISEKEVLVLKRKSDQISQVIEVINSLSRQTNLLALNSGIEAARAGEAGKGFSIIAGEIRKLAESTSSATKQIEEILTEITSGTQRVANSMRQGTGKVDEGAEVVKNALSQLNVIGRSITALSPMIERIEHSTKEQLTISNAVQQAISEVARFIEQSSAATGDVSASFTEINSSMDSVTNTANRLTHGSHTLVSLVEKFKT